MNELQLQQLFDQAAVTRTSGTPQELACAQFLQAQCQALGLQAAIEPFAVPMARGTGTIHNRYDTTALMSMPQMLRDIAFISSFTGRMANAAAFPVGREIPESVKEKLDVYLNRKRKQ